MYKTLTAIVLILTSILQSSCGSTKTQDMKLSKSPFTDVIAYYNTYVAGLEGGGAGIEFYIEGNVLPERIQLEKVYFQNSIGRLMQGDRKYVARFRTDRDSQDVMMSSDPNEEAGNIPPTDIEKFPFTLEDGEAGISFKENGVLKFTKLSNVEKRQSIAYPSAPPRDGGH